MLCAGPAKRVSCAAFGEMAEPVEGAPLLREYGVKSSIEGSNPSLSANHLATTRLSGHFKNLSHVSSHVLTAACGF